MYTCAGPRLGQRVQIRRDVERYGGLFGEIIHREWVTGEVRYRRRHPLSRPDPGRLALVVNLEDPPAGLEPVILCYEDQLRAAPGAG